MPKSFEDALQSLTFVVSPDNRIVNEVAKINCADEGRVILLLGRCLPHIVPNVILAKREVRNTHPSQAQGTSHSS